MSEQHLSHDDEAFVDALSAAVPHPVSLYHTGGGCMVAAIDLTIDARLLGAQVWVTRDESDWILGVYDFYADPEDEGQCVALFLPQPDKRDDAVAVASAIASYVAFWKRSFDALYVEQNGA